MAVHTSYYMGNGEDWTDLAATVERYCGLSDMLSSWKEIAQFFGKGVRTVQRWEKTLDLPVHRPSGASSNVVLARAGDLEEWMHRGQVRKQLESEAGAESDVAASLAELEQEVAMLASRLNAPISMIDGGHSAPERIGAIRSAISRLADVASEVQARRAA